MCVEQTLQDVRYALRGLQRAPGFTLTAAISLGLGIGVNIAVFPVLGADFTTRRPFGAVYVPRPQNMSRGGALLVRSSGRSSDLTDVVKRAVVSVVPDGMTPSTAPDHALHRIISLRRQSARSAHVLGKRGSAAPHSPSRYDRPDPKGHRRRPDPGAARRVAALQEEGARENHPHEPLEPNAPSEQNPTNLPNRSNPTN